MDDNARNDNERKKKLALCCDRNEVVNIIACLCELRNTIACVLECTDDHSCDIKERIILCKILDEIRQIEAKLDNPLFGLNEIKHEIIDINNIITNSTFGLREIKNEVRDIEGLLNNQFFGLNEIKNEIITINDLLNNTTFGIPEIKNEIRIIENSTNTTNNLLTNQVFGLNEIKREIRLIENQTILLTNEIFGLNEIKNEIRGIENYLMTGTPNYSLSCSNDSVLICGRGVDNVVRTIKTDAHNVTATLPSASTHSQTGQLFSLTTSLFVQDTSANFLFLFSNPSTKTMYLDKIMVGSKVIPTDTLRNYVESIRIRIIKNSLIANLGTPLFPTNLNAGFPDTPSIVVTQNPSSGGGILIFDTRVLGDYTSIDFDGRIVVPPNTNIIINFILVQPPTGLSVDLSLATTWYEL